LFLDCWTRGGVELFWPLKYKVKGFVKSGGVVEDVIFVLVMLGDLFLLAFSF